MKDINQNLKESTLFLQTKTSKVQLNIPLTIIVYFLLWLIGLGVGSLLELAILNTLGSMGNVSETIALALRKLMVCGTQITIFFLWVNLVERRPMKSISFQTNRPLKLYITGFIVGLCTITMITVILVLTKAVKIQYCPIDYSYMIINVGIIALGWIVQSASEEIAIRGWLIPSLEKNCTPVMAISITAIIFGILHLFNSGVTVLSFINLTLSGMFFAAYAILNGNIWGVCGLHFAWNFALGNIFGLPVSGFADNGEKIFQTQQIGSNLLTGGDFGHEGGLITTITLMIAIVGLILKWRKDNRNG